MKILKVIMDTASPALLADFYEVVLELPVFRREEETEIVIGSSRIIFRQAASGQKPFYHFAITIPANKIEEAKRWLSRKVPLLWLSDYNNDVADFRNWLAESVYFFDPAGNIVELIARFALSNEREELFSSSQFSAVSEIGVVFPSADIEKNTQALMQRNKLNYFNRQPPFPQFKAVGNDEGLFIIVTEGRNWYPTTDIPAGMFPLHVEFTVDEKLCKEFFQLRQ